MREHTGTWTLTETALFTPRHFEGSRQVSGRRGGDGTRLEGLLHWGDVRREVRRDVEGLVSMTSSLPVVPDPGSPSTSSGEVECDGREQWTYLSLYRRQGRQSVGPNTRDIRGTEIGGKGSPRMPCSDRKLERF